MARTYGSLQRQNLSERVVQQIGLSIMRNDLKAGDTLLSEPELSLQYKVSRPILREALKVLAKKGLIESRPRAGTRVRPREHWNLLDPDVIAWQYEIGLDGSFLQAICEVRLMFEPMSAGLAAARATAGEIDTIEEYCRRMEEALDTVEAYTAIDLQFHAAICAAAHNELIQQIMATLAIPLFASRIVTSHLPGANHLAMPLHRAVAEAIRQRDDQVAENTMRQIVTLTARDIQRALGNKDERKEERA